MVIEVEHMMIVPADTLQNIICFSQDIFSNLINLEHLIRNKVNAETQISFAKVIELLKGLKGVNFRRRLVPLP